MGVQKHDAVAADMSTIPSHVSQRNVLSQVHIQPPCVASLPPNSSPKLSSRDWPGSDDKERERKRNPNPQVGAQGRRRDGENEMERTNE